MQHATLYVCSLQQRKHIHDLYAVWKMYSVCGSPR